MGFGLLAGGVCLRYLLGSSAKAFFSFLGGVFILGVFGILWPRSISMGSDDHWWDLHVVKEVVLFIIMLLGMAVGNFARAIEHRRPRLGAWIKRGRKGDAPKLELDTYEFLYPFLFSFLTFSGIAEVTKDKTLTFSLLTIAFQNGFFWDAIVSNAKNLRRNYAGK